METQVTIVLLVSRKFLLEKLFNRLEDLKLPTTTNLLVLVDGDLNLFLHTKKLVEMSKFNERLCVRADNRNKVSTSQQYRRRRIAELHSQAKQYIQEAEYLFLIEDDGIIPVNALDKLYKLMKAKDAGFVSGVEIGRWTTPYVGAWVTDNPKDPQRIESVDLDGVTEVHAAGFYCMLVKTKIYEKHRFYTDRNYGPDLVFGFSVSGLGHKNYVDPSIVVDHHTEKGTVINFETKTPKKVIMQKNKNIWRFVHRVVK